MTVLQIITDTLMIIKMAFIWLNYPLNPKETPKDTQKPIKHLVVAPHS